MAESYAAEVKRLCPQLSRDNLHTEHRVLSKWHDGACAGLKVGIVVNSVEETEKALKFLATCLLTTIDRLCTVWIPVGRETTIMIRATKHRVSHIRR